MEYFMKHFSCPHCFDTIEIHHIKLHEKSCPLKQENLQKICDYLKRGIVDSRILKRASFYDWAIKNGILTSITITGRFGLENWQQALYQLLVYGYLKGCIDFICVEIILSIVTYGSMWLEEDEYKLEYNKERDAELEITGISEHLYYNYYLLMIHIIHRANKDVLLEDGSLDENKEVVDVNDATTFLYDFAPDLLLNRLKLNLLGDDSITCLQEYMLTHKQELE